MKLVLDLLLMLIAGVWFFMAARRVNRALEETAWPKLLLALPGAMALLGVACLFAPSFPAEGVVHLPNSYEWPAGYVTHVITAADGNYVVPLVDAGRVQIYDPHWRFLRGWNVNALGGGFKVAASPAGAVEVFAAKARRHYIFDENGDLISSVPLLESDELLLDQGHALIVPTPIWLWPLSSPAISLALIGLGLLSLEVLKRLSARH